MSELTPTAKYVQSVVLKTVIARVADLDPRTPEIAFPVIAAETTINVVCRQLLALHPDIRTELLKALVALTDVGEWAETSEEAAARGAAFDWAENVRAETIAYGRAGSVPLDATGGLDSGGQA